MRATSRPTSTAPPGTISRRTAADLRAPGARHRSGPPRRTAESRTCGLTCLAERHLDDPRPPVRRAVGGLAHLRRDVLVRQPRRVPRAGDREGVVTPAARIPRV